MWWLKPEIGSSRVTTSFRNPQELPGASAVKSLLILRKSLGDHQVPSPFHGWAAWSSAEGSCLPKDTVNLWQSWDLKPVGRKSFVIMWNQFIFISGSWFVLFMYPLALSSYPTFLSLLCDAGARSLQTTLPGYLVGYLDVFVWQQWTVMAVSPATFAAATAAKSLQSCPTLCDPIEGSPPGSAAPGILQARTLEWVAISFSSAWKWKVKVKSLSRVWLLATPRTAAHQAPPSMGFSRQEYWSGVPLPSPATFSTSCIYHPWCCPNQRSKLQPQRLSHAWHPPLTLSFW